MENNRKLQKFPDSLLFWIHILAGTSGIHFCDYIVPGVETRHGEPAISPSFSFIQLHAPLVETIIKPRFNVNLLVASKFGIS